MDQPQASHLVKKAFDCWQAGRLAEAVPLYQKALALADPKHYRLPDWHGEFAGVLSDLGRFSEAEEHYKAALAVELAHAEDDFSSAVVIARYFLAQHYLDRNEPELALLTIEAWFKDGMPSEWLLRLVRACALHDLSRIEEARLEAERALAAAPSETKREELSRLFAEKLGEIDG